VRVGDADLAHLTGLKKLESLKLYPYDGDSAVTDAGLESISSLRKLRVLIVPYADGITDAGLPHLLKLKELTHLDITRAGIKGDPVPALIRLKKLRVLGLGSLEGVNDENLKELARRLPDLRELDLARTSVTRFRLARLLPKTKWKRIHMETSLNIYRTPEEAELAAFQEYCRELDVFVDVDQE
jgi:F-box/leucine-rich repeat protein 14